MVGETVMSSQVRGVRVWPFLLPSLLGAMLKGKNSVQTIFCKLVSLYICIFIYISMCIYIYKYQNYSVNHKLRRNYFIWIKVYDTKCIALVTGTGSLLLCIPSYIVCLNVTTIAQFYGKLPKMYLGFILWAAYMGFLKVYIYFSFPFSFFSIIIIFFGRRLIDRDKFWVIRVVLIERFFINLINQMYSLMVTGRSVRLIPSQVSVVL